MPSNRTYVILALSLLVVAPASAADQSPVTWLADCPVAAAPGTRCGELRVPERHDRPDGRSIVVPIAVVPAPDSTPKASEPLLFLMGGTGPGFSALQRVAAVADVFARDVIVIEQRGNPLARPFFGCESVEPEDRFRLIYISHLEYRGRQSVARCQADLHAAGIDIDAYDTPSAARDLIALRRALGITAWHLYGISYGGRVATTLLRLDPDGARSLILDSPQITGSYFSVWDRLAALGDFFDRCAAAPGCGALYPDLRGDFEATVARLAARPALVRKAGAVDTLTARNFLSVAVWAHYRATVDEAVRFPAALAAAGRGDYAPLLAMIGIGPDARRAPAPRTDGYPSAPNNPMQTAQLCAEEFARPTRATAAAATVAREMSPAVVAVARAEEALERQVCRDWRVAPSDPDQARPPTGEAPTLLLFGADDPIAPPAHGRIAERSLSQATLVVFPWTGHAVTVRRQACAMRLIAGFLADPSARIDRACVEAVPEPEWTPPEPSSQPGAAHVRRPAS